MAVPSLTKRIKSAIISNGIIQKITATPIIGKYLNDLAFRGNINICQGMIVNYVYVIFRVITGIRYTSVWFISMAVYYLVLGALRTYLVYCYYHRNQEVEYRCYRKKSMDVIFAEYSHGWYDCSDGAYKFRIHISGLVCTLYFLHNDNSSCQCSKIS